MTWATNTLLFFSSFGLLSLMHRVAYLPSQVYIYVRQRLKEPSGSR